MSTLKELVSQPPETDDGAFVKPDALVQVIAVGFAVEAEKTAFPGEQLPV